MLCQRTGCKNEVTRCSSNPTRKWCSQECCLIERRKLTERIKELKVKYNKVAERERRAIQHFYKMGIKNPTDTQLKDVCDSFVADWHIVKENLELQELCTNKHFFNY